MPHPSTVRNPASGRKSLGSRKTKFTRVYVSPRGQFSKAEALATGKQQIERATSLGLDQTDHKVQVRKIHGLFHFELFAPTAKLQARESRQLRGS